MSRRGHAVDRSSADTTVRFHQKPNERSGCFSTGRSMDGTFQGPARSRRAGNRGNIMRAPLAFALFVGLVLTASAQDPKTNPKTEPKPEVKPPQGWKEYKGGFKNEAYTVWLPPGGELDDKM